MSKHFKIFLLALALGALVFSISRFVAYVSKKDVADAKLTYDYVSPAYHIDRIYKSMQGPSSTESFLLGDENDDELLWITGMRVQMVEADGATPTSNDFMCHTNLNFDLNSRKLWSGNVSISFPRIVTLSQGQYTMILPKGFGIPVRANEPLSMMTQALNLNINNPDKRLRHKVTIDYVRDSDLRKPLVPLYTTAAQVLVLVKGDTPYYKVVNPDPAAHGPGCSLGQAALNGIYKDINGNEFTGHWVVKSGREINSTSITENLKLQYDTTIHYIEVHLHPFAESLALVDRTEGKELFRSHAQNHRDRLGLERVEYFSSVEGIPIYKDHEYELVSTYDNKSAENSDAMAHMVLFLKDKQFLK
ncbi:MAG TPA: hypothetical protein VI749_05155 [Candidatus Omnitrophota bacterium]|nr:hypothetical protein [Candidatus Omnitrophota bacterium]